MNNVLVPVDLRNRLTQPVGEAIGYYVSAVKLSLKYSRQEPFWDIARIVYQKIKRQLTDKNVFASQRLASLSPSLLDALVFAKLGKLDDNKAYSK